MLISAELLTEDKSLLPVEFIRRKIDDYAIRCFFEARITPSTRIDIDRDLQREGLEYYDPEILIRYQKGRSIDDDYWLDCL